MKLKEISASFGFTFNLGDFNFVRIDLSQTAQLEEDDDPEAVKDVLHDDCVNHVYEKLEEAVHDFKNSQVKIS